MYYAYPPALYPLHTIYVDTFSRSIGYSRNYAFFSAVGYPRDYARGNAHLRALAKHPAERHVDIVCDAESALRLIYDLCDVLVLVFSFVSFMYFVSMMSSFLLMVFVVMIFLPHRPRRRTSNVFRGGIRAPRAL